MTVHLLKLCVGADCIGDLLEWQAERTALAANRPAVPVHVTRMWPKREAELLDGGSLYWVFKGQVLARQQILELERRVGEDGVVRCGIALDPEPVLVRPVPQRPFQGWRYLRVEDAPADLCSDERKALPAKLVKELAAIGVV